MCSVETIMNLICFLNETIHFIVISTTTYKYIVPDVRITVFVG